MSGIEELWGPVMARNAGSYEVRKKRFLGVLELSLHSRQVEFWNDIERMVRKYWSHGLEKVDRPGVNHIFFRGIGPFGTVVSALITGKADGTDLDIHMTSYRKDGTQIETMKRRFGTHQTIREMVEWIDSMAVRFAKEDQR